MASGRTAVGQAHAKVIIVGEHAAVFGYPVLAAPLPALTVRTEAWPAEGPITLDCPLYAGPLAEAPGVFDGIKALVEAALAKLSRPDRDLELKVQSDVPIGRGLGSSAALAASLVQAIYRSCGAPLDRETLLRLVGVAESFAHGAASGVDAAAVVAEGMVSFRRGLAAVPLRPARPLHFVIADSGLPSETRGAVEGVRRRLVRDAEDTRTRLETLGRLAEGAQAAATQGDTGRLGQSMNDAQCELEALGVSLPALDRLVLAARNAGALGAKLTGGGRGGCVLALARDPGAAEHLARAMRAQGARATWLASFGGEEAA